MINSDKIIWYLFKEEEKCFEPIPHSEIKSVSRTLASTNETPNSPNSSNPKYNHHGVIRQVSCLFQSQFYFYRANFNSIPFERLRAVTIWYFPPPKKEKKISFHIVNKQTSVLLLDSFAIERAVCSFQLFHMKFGEKVWLLHSLFVNCTAFVSLFFLFLFMCTVPSFAIVIYYV